MADNLSFEDKCREEVCSKCPGTEWGMKSICKIHKRSIGMVESCHQWDEYGRQNNQPNKPSISFFDMEPAMEAIQRVEQDLKDYSWMVHQIELVEEDEVRRNAVANNLIHPGVSASGIEATLPKAPYTNSDVTYREAKKGLRSWERAKRYETKVKKLEAAVETLEDERERLCAEALMDDEPITKIAQSLDVSRGTLYEIKKSLVRKLAWRMYNEKNKELVSNVT